MPPLAANMNAAFKKVQGEIGATDAALADLIVTRIVELAKDGVYDVEELSRRTLSSLSSPTKAACAHPEAPAAGQRVRCPG